MFTMADNFDGDCSINWNRREDVGNFVLKNFMTPFYGWNSAVSRVQGHWGRQFKSQGGPGTHLIDIKRMKGCVDLAAT